jgi:protein FAM50
MSAPSNDTGAGASDRAAALASQRESERAAFNASRAAAAASAAAPAALDARFSGSTSAAAEADALFRRRTVGLVTQEEYAAAQEAAAALEVELKSAGGGGGGGGGGGAARRWPGARGAAAPAPAVAGVKRMAPTLSFEGEEEEGGGGEGGGGGGAAASAASRRGGPRKDPTVATSFLPDAEREAREASVRAAARAEWAALQDRIRGEPLAITYSYWDGTGHRREATVQKGATIGRFLEAARADLAKEFPELRATSASALMYVKEDLILPPGLTFYELIQTGARGKSGPLFVFDVRDDVRLSHDARVEREDSHPGKVVDKRWYEKNKHQFPYNRWELFNVGKGGGGAAPAPYTIK